MSRSVLVAVALLFLFPSFPAIAQPAGFGETVEVRLGTIDVVVTQAGGLSAIGLLPEDFELLVDGKLQQITGFDEVRESRQATRSPSASAPRQELKRPRYIVLFMDLYSLPVRQKQEVFGATGRMLDKLMQPGDQIMVVTWNRGLNVPLPFTSDRAAIDSQLKKLETVAGSALAADRQVVRTRVNGELQFAQSSSNYGYRTAYDQSIRAARSFAEEQLRLTKNLAAATREVIKNVAGVEGRKVMLFVGENLPQFPGLGMLEFVNETFERYLGIEGIKPINAQQMMMNDFNLTSVRRELTEAANEHGVTFYAIYSGQPTELALEANGNSITSDDSDFRNTAGQITSVAEDTGGMALSGSRNYSLTADTIAQDLSNYYTLAWNASGQKENARIEVRTKRPGLRVRTRKSFGGKTLDEEIADRVVSRLYQASAKESRLAVVKLGKPVKARKGRLKVPVEIVFPSSILTLVPQDGKLLGRFDVVVAASGGKGNLVSDVTRQSQNVSWTEGTVPQVVSYKFEVVMRDQPSTVSIGVVDGLSKTALYRRAKFEGGS